jgi:hypothetical protein
VTDYSQQFGKVYEQIVSSSKGMLGKLDHFLYKSLVNFLRSDDYEAVATALDQLVHEKKEIAIPPIYFVSVAHPNERARQKARESLKHFNQDKKIEELTHNKETREAVTALIKEFGNYKDE